MKCFAVLDVIHVFYTRGAGYRFLTYATIMITTVTLAISAIYVLDCSEQAGAYICAIGAAVSGIAAPFLVGRRILMREIETLGPVSARVVIWDPREQLGLVAESVDLLQR